VTAAELMVKIGADVSGAKRGLDDVNKRVSGFSNGAKMAAVAGVGAIALGVGAVVKGAANYESSLNTLKAVTGASSKEMEQLSKKAITLGNDVTLPGTSAADAAAAMTELAKGGLSVRDSMDAAKGVLQLSAAAQIGNADAATITARALNSFGLKGNDAVRVADLLAAGANASTADISDLALGMQAAGAVFHSSGQSIDTLTTSLGLMSNAGISGSDAGTSLKTMMMRLVPSTKAAKDEMHALGVKATDAHGNFLPLRDVIDQYHGALAKLNPEQRQMALQTIFGSDAIRAANVLFGEGVTKFDAMHTAVEKHGAAADLASAKMQGFNGAMEALKSTVETAEIVIGTAMLPVLTQLAGALNKGANFLMAHKGALEAVVAVVTAFAAPLAIAAGAVKALTIAQGALNLVMEANPIILIISILIALGVAFVLAYQHCEKFRDIVNGAFRAIKSAAQPVIDWLAHELPRAWETIKSATTSAWNAISSFVKAHIGQVQSAVSTGLAAVRATFTAVWNAIAPVVSAAFSVIKGIVSSGIATVHHVISAVMAAIHGDWSRAWGELKAAAVTMLNGAVAAIKGILTGLGPAVFSLAVSVGSQIVSGVLSGVSSLGGALKSKVEGMLHSALSSLNPFSPVEHGGEKYIGRPIADGAIAGYLLAGADLPKKISQHLKDTLDTAKGVVDGYRSTLTDAFQRLTGDALKAFDANTTSMLDKLTSKFDRARSRLQGRQESLTPAEKALKDLQDRRTAEQRTADYEKAQGDLREALASGDEQRIAEARERCRQLDLDALERVLQAQADIERAAKDKRFAEEQAKLDAEQKQQALDLQARRDLKRRHLEDELKDLEVYLEKHPKAWGAVHAKIMGMFANDFGPGFKTAGHNLGKAFAQGLDDASDAVHTAAKNLARIVQKYLKLNSPAEAGPLSSLDQWWTALGPTLLSGAELESVSRALAGAVDVSPNLGGVFRAAGGRLSGALSGGASGSGGGLVWTGDVIVHGSVTSENELVESIRNAVITKGRLNAGGMFANQA
jgi:TP901 family phage tail tape measure protein